jgi:hypothetical protein
VALTRTVVGENLEDPGFLSIRMVCLLRRREKTTGRLHLSQSRHYPAATARSIVSSLLNPEVAEVRAMSFQEMHDSDPATCELELTASSHTGTPHRTFRTYECSPDRCNKVHETA